MKTIHKSLHIFFFQSLLLVTSSRMVNQACINHPATICEKPLQCKTGNLIADPEDCKKYYLCTKQEWIHKDVAPGTAYNYEDCQIVHEAVVTCFDESNCDSMVSTSTAPITETEPQATTEVIHSTSTTPSAATPPETETQATTEVIHSTVTTSSAATTPGIHYFRFVIVVWSLLVNWIQI